MSRTLILGGGFGGITVATELRERLGESHEIVLVDRSDHFSMGLRKLWQLVGMGTIREGSRSRSLLAERGIRFVQSEIESIDPVARRAETSEGTLEGDHLVVALGAVPRPDLVPGLAEHGHNAWAPSAIPGLQKVLSTAGSNTSRPTRVVILIAGVPYTCPPAPFECAMLLDDFFRRRGVREHVHLSVVTLQPILLPNAGKSGSDWLADVLGQKNIEHATGRRVVSVEAGKILFKAGESGSTSGGGTAAGAGTGASASAPISAGAASAASQSATATLDFDILIGVPPHRTPKVVRASGLVGEDGWVQIDPRTLATRFAGVYAIGDITKTQLENGMQLPGPG